MSSNGNTKSPLHEQLQRQVENNEKLKPAERPELAEEFMTLAMCHMEDHQHTAKWRSSMKTELVSLRTQVGEVSGTQSEILNGINEIRGQRNGSNGTVITIKSGMFKKIRDNWILILFVIFASGGSVATFLNFFKG